MMDLILAMFLILYARLEKSAKESKLVVDNHYIDNHFLAEFEVECGRLVRLSFHREDWLPVDHQIN